MPAAFNAFVCWINPVRGDAATAKYIPIFINRPIRHSPNNFANGAFAFTLRTFIDFHIEKINATYDIELSTAFKSAQQSTNASI